MIDRGETCPTCARGRVKPPRSVVCHLGGVSRRVRAGDRFAVDHLGGALLVEVVGIEAVAHESEEDGYAWNSWRPVLRAVGAAEPLL